MIPRVIGIDARELLGDRTGVGRYLGELVRRWVGRADAGNRHFILYAPAPLDLHFPAAAVTVRILPGSRGTWWEQTALRAAVRRERLSVFFAPAYTAPLGVDAPLAVTIHDVSFSRHPEWFRAREGFRRRWLTRRAARRAAVVFTVSEFSRGEIHALYGVPRERIEVVPNGVTSLRAPARPREPMVLYTGSIFNRRRVPDLIAAFARTAAAVPEATLVIVGDNRTWPAQDLDAAAAAHGVTARVRLLPHLGDTDLADLYARASVFAFLSEYEGFGLTPLEALSAGVPIVVLDTPVAREVYGDAARFVPAGDITAAADALTTLLTDRDAADAIVGRAGAVLSRYSWEAAADRTIRALDAVAT